MQIEVLQGDITKIRVDAIVNAANSALRGGRGVDGAIHRAGGPTIMSACRQIGGCPTGEAVITTAGDLPARKVIHTVGPVWSGGGAGEPELLKNAYWNSLRLAEENDLKTVSFPNISTGVYGYPKDKAAIVAVDTVREYSSRSSSIDKVIFVCFDDENYGIYTSIVD